MNWFEAWQCGCGMLGAFVELDQRDRRAALLVAPEHLFRCTPLSDFARQGKSLLCSSTSSRLGMPAGICGLSDTCSLRTSIAFLLLMHSTRRRRAAPRVRSAACIRRSLQAFDVFAHRLGAARSAVPLGDRVGDGRVLADRRLGSPSSATGADTSSGSIARAVAARNRSAPTFAGHLGEFAVKRAVAGDEGHRCRPTGRCHAAAHQQRQQSSVSSADLWAARPCGRARLRR